MEEVERFIHSVVHNQNLLLLLPKEKWQLNIQIGIRKLTIELSKNGIEIQNSDDVKTKLICTEEDWLAIVSGVCKLRQCIRLGSTVYTGNFSSLLMLESLFFLQAKVK